MTISANRIVTVVPNVLSAGGRALDIVSVLLTTSTRVPIGAIQPFPDADSVGSYFGLSSVEYGLATIYFNGFDNSNVKPSLVYFAQYNTAAVASWIRGGTLGLTLTQLKAIPTGTLVMNFNGTTQTAAAVNLSTATSFSNAASIIQAAFTSPPFTVAYDSQVGAFVFTSTSSGASFTVDYASDNALAEALKLTEATGAVISQGADAAVPGPFMDAVKGATQDWALFMTCFDPDSSGNTNKLAFSAWANAQSNRFGYVCWDVDLSPATTVPATSSLGYIISKGQLNYTGTYLIAGDGQPGSAPASASHAAFICGTAASIDFTETNGRITFAFRSQTGLASTCTTDPGSANLEANGYNYYGAFATANDNFIWNYQGSVSGPFSWFDSFINQIWLNNQLQLAMMVLFQNSKSIPYNDYGYGLIKAAALDPIKQALNFGAIRAGVTLSQAQIAEVNAAAGLRIDDAINQAGYYFQVKDADPQTRVARKSPPITLWYADGQSVQRINVTSVNVQ